MKKIISLIIAILILSTMLFSCSVSYTEEEIIEVAKNLIESSYDVNEIYFGKGLPVDEDYDDISSYVDNAEDLSAEDLEVESVQYVGVDPESGYSTLDDLKNIALKVYSKEYCEDIFIPAFEGVSDEDTGSVKYSRFMINLYDTLCERKDIVEDGPVLLRTYKLDTIKVQEMKENRCKITVKATLDDGYELDVRLFLVKNEDGSGWRLDTPTYIVSEAMEPYNPDIVTTNAE